MFQRINSLWWKKATKTLFLQTLPCRLHSSKGTKESGASQIPFCLLTGAYSPAIQTSKKGKGWGSQKEEPVLRSADLDNLCLEQI